MIACEDDYRIIIISISGRSVVVASVVVASVVIAHLKGNTQISQFSTMASRMMFSMASRSPMLYAFTIRRATYVRREREGDRWGGGQKEGDKFVRIHCDMRECHDINGCIAYP